MENTQNIFLNHFRVFSIIKVEILAFKIGFLLFHPRTAQMSRMSLIRAFDESNESHSSPTSRMSLIRVQLVEWPSFEPYKVEWLSFEPYKVEWLSFKPYKVEWLPFDPQWCLMTFIRA